MPWISSIWKNTERFFLPGKPVANRDIVLQLFSDENLEDLKYLFKHCRKAQSGEVFTALCIRGDDKKIWLRGHYHNIRWQGKRAALVTARDVTEQVEKEKIAKKLQQENLRRSILEKTDIILEKNKMLKKLKLDQKLLLIGISLTIIPLACAFGFVFHQNKAKTELAKQESIKLADADLQHIVESIYTLAKTQQEVIEKNLEHALNVTEDLPVKAGGLQLSPASQTWEAVNQYSKAVSSVTLPKVYIGDTWLGQISDKNQEAPLVDEVFKLVARPARCFR